MRRNHWFLVALASFSAGLVACGKTPDPGPTENEQELRQEAARRVPLDSVYSTTGQKELKRVTRRPDESYGNDLSLMLRDWGTGLSNAFLVLAQDLTGAIKATREAFSAAAPADIVVGRNKPLNASTLWLVAYLGTDGSTPPAWLIESVELDNKTIRVVYQSPRRTSSTNDSHQYFIWVPLDQRQPGTYTLELVDAETKQPSLVRRVKVLEAK